jgi:hypothetical protein
MSKVRNFFWWCSGANIDELRKYPTDYNTYFSIGAAVFLTALLAFFSGGYWFYIVFDSVYVSIAFALIYAMLIFNIDRFVVLNMSKSGRGLSMLLNALPRILLAVVISLFIANPLELRYFETEIKNKIEDNLELYRQAYIDSSSFVLQQEKAKTEIANNPIANLYFRKQTQLQDLKLRFIDETQGIEGKSSGKMGVGPIAKAIENEMLLLQKDIDSLALKYEPLRLRYDTVINASQKEQISKLNEELNRRRASIGLLDRNMALQQICENPSARFIHWLIILVILTFETAPILAKLFSRKGPYDHRIDEILETAKISAEQKLSNLESEHVNNLFQQNDHNARLRMEAYGHIKESFEKHSGMTKEKNDHMAEDQSAQMAQKKYKWLRKKF